MFSHCGREWRLVLSEQLHDAVQAHAACRCTVWALRLLRDQHQFHITLSWWFPLPWKHFLLPASGLAGNLSQGYSPPLLPPSLPEWARIRRHQIKWQLAHITNRQIHSSHSAAGHLFPAFVKPVNGFLEKHFTVFNCLLLLYSVSFSIGIMLWSFFSHSYHDYYCILSGKATWAFFVLEFV